MKTIAAHAATALITLALASLLIGGRGFPARPVPAAQIPRRPAAPVPAPAPIPARPPAPAPVAPAIPAEVLRRVDADEEVNIRVYDAANRGVVNITAGGEEADGAGDEPAGGSGSGFFIDRQGHILTNYHVVEGADAVKVTLFDGSTHEGKVVGRDPSGDVAVVAVRVPADRIWPLPLGDSAAPRLAVGQKVLALGNPFGLERTLTTGIISSLDRSIRARNGRMIKGVIQTDAAINPGNSGGPLLNSRGQVIGVTTAIYSRVGQSSGIGFAIPIGSIRRILRPLIEEGRVVRADLGIRRVLTTDAGLLLLDLVEDGPSDRAGLRPIRARVERIGPYLRRRLDPDTADLIVAVDGKPIKSVDDLLSEVEARAPGEAVTVTVIRDGKRQDVPVTLGRS